jgi:amino acid permease
MEQKKNLLNEKNNESQIFPVGILIEHHDSTPYGANDHFKTTESKNVEQDNVAEISSDPNSIDSNIKHHSSLLNGIYNITNTTIGAGILALPFQIRSLGLIPGIFLLVFIGILSTFTLHLLNEINPKSKVSSYLEVSYNAYGKLGQLIVALSIWLLLIAAIAVYIVVIGNYLVGSIKYLRHIPRDQEMSEWYCRSEFLSACVVLVVGLPLSLLPKFSKLAYGSLACLIAVFYLNILIIYQFICDVSQPTWKWPPLTMAQFEVSSFLPSLATIGMAYINQVSIYNVTAELKRPTPKRRLILIITSNLIVLVVYTAFALFGYLDYGDRVSDNILENEPLDLMWTTARIAVIFVLAFSIPLLVFPTRQCFDWLIQECYFLIQGFRRVSKDDTKSFWNRIYRYRYIIEAILTLCLAYSIAIAFRALGKILEFFGSVTGSAILYIFPCLFYMRVVGGGFRKSLRSHRVIDFFYRNIC